MQVFSSLSAARQALPEHKKWTRAFTAIATATSQPAGIMFSVVDSLTWFKFAPGFGCVPPFSVTTDPGVLMASRRYFHALYVSVGTVSVETAELSNPALTRKRAYSDLDDREFFTGPTTTGEVSAGQLAIFEVSEALRFTPSAEAEGVLFRITVEGATFANK